MTALNLYIATTIPGVSYKVKQICAEPQRFVAYVSSPPLQEEPLHRLGCDLNEALEHVGRHAAATNRSLDLVVQSLGLAP